MKVSVSSKFPTSILILITFCIQNIIVLLIDAFTAFASRDEIFHKGRDKSELVTVYSSYISRVLSGFRGSNNVGALIMEPGKIFYEVFSLVVIVPFYFRYLLLYPNNVIPLILSLSGT